MSWQLVADIGGTNARFAALPSGQLESEHQFFYTVAEHQDFIQLLAELLEDIGAATGWHEPPQAACLAVACPADGERVSFTNSHWQFSKTDAAAALGCELLVINDFAAVAHGVAQLSGDDLLQVGGGTAETGKAIAVIGPGTGLGVSGLVPSGNGYAVIEGEGGHVSFAPTGSRQLALLGVLQERFGDRVSVERLLSGAGLVNIYTALAALDGSAPRYTEAAQVSAAALAGDDLLASETLALFCEILGSVAGDLALTLGATGGVYLAGGILPRVRELFVSSDFRRCFEAKGRFVNYLAAIPVYLVVREQLGLLGAAHYLYSRVKAIQPLT